jgi:hypothetical protein
VSEYHHIYYRKLFKFFRIYFSFSIVENHIIEMIFIVSFSRHERINALNKSFFFVFCDDILDDL